MSRSWSVVRSGVPALVVALFAVAISCAGPISEPDVLWQARTGLDILTSGQVPHADSYSWLVAGQPWVPNSWAWDVLLAVAYRCAGLAGLSVVAGASALAAMLVLTVLARRAGASWWVITGVVVLVATVEHPWLTARPQVAGYVLAPLLVAAAGRALGGGRWGWSALGVLVCTFVWVNAHLSGLLAPVLVGACGAGAIFGRLRADGRWVRPDVRLLARAGALVLADAATVLATPYGVSGAAKGVSVPTASFGVVNEWAPIGWSTSVTLLAAVVALTGAAASWWAWRHGRFVQAAVVAVLVVATCGAVRFAPLLAMVCAPLWAQALSHGRPGRYLASRAMPAAAALGALVIVMLVCALPMLSATGTVVPGGGSLSAARSLPAGCRLFNSYATGGLVILERPDVTVSMDGRNDLYGRDMVAEHISVLAGGPQAAQWIREREVTCALVADGGPLEVTLTERGWGRRAADQGWVALVRG